MWSCDFGNCENVATVHMGNQPADQHSLHMDAKRRAAQKELAAVERRMDKTASKIEGVHAKMADHDQSDFDGLMKLTEKLRQLESENDELEEHWLELSEAVE